MERLRGSYSLAATVGWAQFLLIQFPEQIVTPFRFVGTPNAWMFVPLVASSLAQYAGLIVAYAVVAIIVDTVRGAIGVRSKLMPPDLRTKVAAAVRNQGIPVSDAVLARTMVVNADLSMGAHVRGVLYPRIVMSAGMAVGLLRRDDRANAIISHESAHIAHHDRLLPGVIGLVCFDLFGSLIAMAWNSPSDGLMAEGAAASIAFLGIYKLVLYGVTISILSKNREYYADARALQLCADPKVYMDILRAKVLSSGSRWRFFHPTFAERVREAERGFTGLRRATVWRAYLLASIIISFAQTTWAGDNLSTGAFFYIQAELVVAIGMLCFEPLRSLLYRASPGATLSGGLRFAVPRWVLRLGFLLIGMFVAVVAAQGVDEEHRQTALGILGGIVYVIFSATKAKKPKAAPGEQ